MTSDPSNPAASAQLSNGVPRRTVVLLCAASAAAGVLGTTALSRLTRPPSRTHAWDALASSLLPMDEAGWPALGAQCDAALADRNRPIGSTRDFAGFAYTDTGVITPQSLPTVQSALEDRIAEEFGQGRVLVVDRWVLSETQAALCALAARSGAGES